MKWLVVAAIIFSVNLLPAFGPPTWSLLVFGIYAWDLNPWVLVPVAVLSAGMGRYVLALGTRWLRPFFSHRYISGLEAVESSIGLHRRRAFALGALFLFSPLPSAQLFIAVGLLGMPLVRITTCFMLGRLVTYSIYVSSTVAFTSSLGSALGQTWKNGWAVSIQVVFIALLAAAPLLAERRSRGRK